MTSRVLQSPEEARRRRRERTVVGILLLVLILFTWVEVHLLKTSSQLPVMGSVFFFGLMNLNIILIMVLLFLVFRNVIKLVLDEKDRQKKPLLKTQLVFCFILFAIIPTVLLFSISAFYIKSSFDKWFNVKVEQTLQRSIEVVRNYYENTQRNADHFAKKIGFILGGGALSSERIPSRLEEYRVEYGLDGLEYYATPFSPRVLAAHPGRETYIPPATLESLKREFSGKNECGVHSVGGGELVRCGAYLGVGRGVIYASFFIPTGLASQLSGIALTYSDYKSKGPVNYPMKSTYFAVLLMVTLLILFAALWTGFYVARRISVPVEQLVKGTAEVAKGNLDYQIVPSGSDEFYQLIELFNRMTRELQQNKREIESANVNLTEINRELDHRRRYIEVLLESLQSGVISIDGHGRVSMINQAASDLLRYSGKEIIGKSYWVLLPEQFRAGFREIVASVLGTAKPVRRELRFRVAKGEWVTLLVTLSVLRDENRRQIGVVVVLDDVTDIQKMERMLAWREVARRIAHEIKNPLTPIQLSVQRLRRRYLEKIADAGIFDEATDIILREVDSLKTLVNEFSVFARLPEIQQVPESLNDITLEAVNLFRSAHEKIVFDLHFAENLPQMELDRAQLKRALINLFDNAVDAMKGQGTISVITEFDRELGLVRLSVADEGCGIAEAAYSQLFEPYFSTKEGGTGLGLAIVQHIVTDHGGFVRAAANQPKGAKFTIELPASLIVGKRKRSVAHFEQLDANTGVGLEGGGA